MKSRNSKVPVFVVVLAGRGIALKLNEEEANLPGHIAQLLRAAAAVHCTIHHARDTGILAADLVYAAAACEFLTSFALQMHELHTDLVGGEA